MFGANWRFSTTEGGRRTFRILYCAARMKIGKG
jgi:hypothetical protein